ncbi:MAG: hypothetical protein IKY10_01575, partial [Clostridia bacterium]|nr:hypothetical protein [Clostridia bacterium]
SYKKISELFCVDRIPEDAKIVLENFDKIIQSIKPLNSKQLQQLPENIRELSHQMTDNRASRRLGYMNENIQLSAYVRYFVWWNLVRLTRLFSNLEEKCFPQEDCFCLDLGSGPLTVVSALWLSRPELRNKNLTWYCLDVSQNSLSLGEDIYLSIASKTPPIQEGANPHWKIIRVKDSFGAFIKQKCGFITCANMFNELDQASDMPPEFRVKKYFDQLKTYSEENARYLLIEPGVPKSARTLCLFRDRFLKANYDVTSPCPHADICSMDGFKAYTGSKNKWCNFSFNTEDAPKKLQRLSELAKLPKERAVLSFVSAVPKSPENESDEFLLRIVSDCFKLPKNKNGFYACSKIGTVVVSTEKQNEFKSGDLISVKIKKPVENLPTDYKTGYKIISL